MRAWLALGLCVAAWQAQAEGFLRAEDRRIVDARGEPVLLRGLGLGGWMLQEGYMLQLGNLGQQHVIRRRIEALIGPERTAEFYAAWLEHHTTKADIDAMAAWGYNSVRLPMHYALFTPPIDEEPVAGEITWRATGFELTDRLLQWTKANGMWLILDLHAAPGGQGNDLPISDRDPSKPSLWESAANRRKTVALWRKLAERYRDEPGIGAYNLINEPNWGFADSADRNGCNETGNAPLWSLTQQIVRAIREVDTRHMIIIEGNCWGNNYAGLPPLWDDNLVLSFHKYWNYNTPDSIATPLELRQERNVPIWLGESGENSNAWFADAIRLAETHDIGWAFWPLKKLGFNNPLEVKPNADYLTLVEYWNDRAPRPSAEFAYSALMRLAREDLRFENNVVHPDVVDAMLRQPHSDMPRPFKPHRIDADGLRIAAVDYDLGRVGHAYFDIDVANHHVATGGERRHWNHGRTYRNDGVDIAIDPADGRLHLDHLEAGEWMQYTVDAAYAGSHALGVVVAVDTAGGRIAITVNQGVTRAHELPARAGTGWTDVALGEVELLRGNNTLRVRVDRGGYRLAALALEPVATHGDGR
jgi:endoglucanase